jgi:hypothetical protein
MNSGGSSTPTLYTSRRADHSTWTGCCKTHWGSRLWIVHSIVSPRGEVISSTIIGASHNRLPRSSCKPYRALMMRFGCYGSRTRKECWRVRPSRILSTSCSCREGWLWMLRGYLTPIKRRSTHSIGTALIRASSLPPQIASSTSTALGRRSSSCRSSGTATSSWQPCSLRMGGYTRAESMGGWGCGTRREIL